MRISLGVLALVVGIAGLILPILPGLVFIFLGISLLAPGSRIDRWMKARIHAMREYFRRK